MNKTHQLCDSLRIRIDDLRLGMFILELDRPWTQTPFPLQGFLLTEKLDLRALQVLVKELIIDPNRSSSHALIHLPFDVLYEVRTVKMSTRLVAPKSSLALRGILAQQQSQLERVVEWLHSKFRKTDYVGVRRLRHHPKKTLHHHRLRPHQPELDDLESEDDGHEHLDHTHTVANRKFAAMMRGMEPRDANLVSASWWERWLNWSENGRTGQRSLRKRGRPLRQKQRPDFVPEDIHLVSYHDQVPMTQELLRAREVMEQASALIEKLQSDLRNMQSLELKEVMPTVQLLSESVIANPSAMMWLLRMRAGSTVVVSHALKVAVYILVLGRHIGFNKKQLIELGFIGLLLDIGKLEMPETLMQKPSKLSPEEASIIQTHVDASIVLLEEKEALSPNVKLGIREHHERMDGSGYPHGLAGAEISIFGRMAAIADSFAAMTSERPYGAIRSSFDAMKELFRMAEGQLHAPLVEEFVQAIGIFPVGSLIQLNTGEVAIVLEHNKVRRLNPKILLLTRADKTPLEKPMLFDLLHQDLVDERVRISIVTGLPDGAYGIVCHDFYKA